MCSEDGKGLIDENPEPSRSKEEGLSATEVLDAALNERKQISMLRKQAIESRAKGYHSE